MSHHIYTTPGFIVHSSSHGEAGRFFLAFTRDLGMIGAIAQGVRLSQSKLRYYTQDFSFSLFSLVRGKEVWRMTGAKELPGASSEISDADNKKLFVRVLLLLKRLLHGEEKNDKLFEIMDSVYIFLSKDEISEKRELVEYVTVLRILHCLGYIRKTSLDIFFESESLNDEILEKLKTQKDGVIKEINNALKESQL